jgi:hypothetical protein
VGINLASVPLLSAESYSGNLVDVAAVRRS